MSHFSQVIDSKVVAVIVADQAFIDSGAVGDPTCWIQTSYNTLGGIHYGPDGLPDGGAALRKNFAGIGYTYDPILDAFVPPQPFPSWVLGTDTCQWEAPTPYPDDGNLYMWDEQSTTWVAINGSTEQGGV